MRFWILGGALLVMASQLAACGSVQSTMKIRTAKESVEATSFSDASEHSVYESVMAESYLEKARLEWAQSDWQHASRYADRAAFWAERAQERAAEKGKPTGVTE